MDFINHFNLKLLSLINLISLASTFKIFQTMKNPMMILLLLPFAFATGCSNTASDKKTNNTDSTYTSEGINANEDLQKPQNQQSITKKKAIPAKEELVMFKTRSPKYKMLMSEMPIPESWKPVTQKRNDKVFMTGPYHLKVTSFQGGSYLWTNDQYMQQMYAQSGQSQSLRPMPSIDELIKQDFEPVAAKEGLKLVKKYSVPEIAAYDKWYKSQLFQSVPTMDQFWAIGTEWEDAEGNPSFVLIHLISTQSNGLLTWYYYCHGLEADKSYFQKAIDHLIHGLKNTKFNPQYLQAYNEEEARKAGQSWAAHRQRMAQNQRNFEATQKAYRDNSNAISDMMMEGWKTRNEITDRGQENYINSIRDENTMIDPSTGKAYQVESGYNQYWINSDGEYISTDDYNYNPNLDPTMNNDEWQQMKGNK